MPQPRMPRHRMHGKPLYVGDAEDIPCKERGRGTSETFKWFNHRIYKEAPRSVEQ